MKTTRSAVWMSVTCLLLLNLRPNIYAQNRAESFLFTEGQVWAVRQGKATPLEEDIELPINITVSTNGTFTVATHSPRVFLEGQILRADGMLISPDGRIEPALDHVAMRAGRTVSSVNGEGNVVTEIQLGREKRLTWDRALVGRDRSWMRVIDGQLFTPEGQTIPAVDTISLHKGRVVVQKEGSQLIVDPGRSIMMNDGTKVYGDGRVASRDGQTTKLTEGQILTIAGVVKLR